MGKPKAEEYLNFTAIELMKRVNGDEGTVNESEMNVLVTAINIRHMAAIEDLQDRIFTLTCWVAVIGLIGAIAALVTAIK